MASVQDVLSWQTSELDSTASQLQKLGSHIGSLASLASLSGIDWSGSAASAAKSDAASLGSDTRDFSARLGFVSEAVSGASSQISEAQQIIRSAQSTLQGGFALDSNGNVITPPPLLLNPSDPTGNATAQKKFMQDQAAASTASVKVKQAMMVAEQADQALSQILSSAFIRASAKPGGLVGAFDSVKSYLSSKIDSLDSGTTSADFDFQFLTGLVKGTVGSSIPLFELVDSLYPEVGDPQSEIKATQAWENLGMGIGILAEENQQDPKSLAKQVVGADDLAASPAEWAGEKAGDIGTAFITDGDSEVADAAVAAAGAASNAAEAAEAAGKVAKLAAVVNQLPGLVTKQVLPLGDPVPFVDLGGSDTSNKLLARALNDSPKPNGDSQQGG